ncbi:MAG: hypothetical protein AAFQ68_25395, partial [Bacteroidota bacterium]
MRKLLLMICCLALTQVLQAQYQGQAWGDANNGPWKFSQDTTANLSVGNAYTRGAVNYSGVPAWAYDIGDVDTTGVLPTQDPGSLVAGLGGTQAGTNGN